MLRAEEEWQAGAKDGPVPEDCESTVEFGVPERRQGVYIRQGCEGPLAELAKSGGP